MGFRIVGVFPQTDAEEAVLNKKRSKKTEKKYKERQRTAKVETALEDQFMTGRVLGKGYLLSVNSTTLFHCLIERKGTVWLVGEGSYLW